jgi:hypothetical protein
MATLYSDNCSTTTVLQPKTNLGVNIVRGTYTVSANLAAADVIQMVKVPSGAKIVDVKIAASATLGGTLTAEVGDGNSTNRFIVSGTFGQGAASAAQTLAPAGVGYAYTADDTIDIKINTAATQATGAVITLVATYLYP